MCLKSVNYFIYLRGPKECPKYKPMLIRTWASKVNYICCFSSVKYDLCRVKQLFRQFIKLYRLTQLHTALVFQPMLYQALVSIIFL